MITLHPLPGLPEVAPGDDLAELLHTAAVDAEVSLDRGALVVCQKVVSKAEGRLTALADVTPRPLAIEIAEEFEKDPERFAGDQRSRSLLRSSGVSNRLPCVRSG